MYTLTIVSQLIGSDKILTDSWTYDREVIAFCNFKEELQWETTISANVTDSAGTVLYQENGSFH